MGFLSKYGKPIVALVLVILVAAGVALGYSKANQYWQMVKDQIVQEQRDIQVGLEQQIKIIGAQKKNAEDQVVRLKAERDLIKIRYVKLQGERDELAKKLAAIVIPTDPDGVVRGLQQAGLRSAHTRPK